MALEKAMLIRLDDGEEAPSAETIRGYRANEEGGDGERWMRVHFNPDSLKTSLSTNLKSSDRGGSGRTGGQYIEKSESTLTLELLFDTSTTAPDIYEEPSGAGTVTRIVHSDVRRITRTLATFFLQTRTPGQAKSSRPPPPSRCHFRWGSFGFTGMVSSMTETLDYFSPDGVPLRASVSLSLKEDRFQFQSYEVADSQHRVRSALVAVGQQEAAAGTGAGATQAPSQQAVVADLNDPNHTAGQRPRTPPPMPSQPPPGAPPPPPPDLEF
jgi:hypothetical protein